VGSHPSSLAGDAEILARESSAPERGVLPGRCTISPRLDPPSPARRLGLFSDCSTSICVPPARPLWLKTAGEGDDVAEVRGVGPVLGEDGAGVWFDLAEGNGAPAGPLEAEVESSDA
jgi:hypothetical protein